MKWIRCVAAAVVLGALLIGLEAAPAQVPGMPPQGGDMQKARELFGWDPLKALKVQTFLLVVAGAIAVGAVLAWHPFAFSRASIEDLDQPKIIVTYTVVGALVGIVVEASATMALVVFGIGGLMRFRTDVGPAKDTGRVILSLILGIACGLQLWMVAILGAAIAWVLIAALECRIGMRMVVRGVKPEVVAQAAEAYGGALRAFGCRFATPRKNPAKGTVSFILRVRRGLEREAIEAECQAKVHETVRGTVDWPEE